jgi:hypothetical protein
MAADPENWRIPFMDFVDDFRYYKDPSMIAESFAFDHPRFDAIIAAMVEYLCDEIGLETPGWIIQVPCLEEPWFVAGMKRLRALAIVECPSAFRRRNIFVLRNFLYRV